MDSCTSNRENTNSIVEYDRRNFILMGLSAPVLASCCTTIGGDPPTIPGSNGNLIDIHCHLFNASDIPAVRFIKIVFLRIFPNDSKKSGGIEDPTVLDELINFIFTPITALAPSAEREISVLRDISNGNQIRTDEQLENDIANIIANFLKDGTYRSLEIPRVNAIKNAKKEIVTAASLGRYYSEQQISTEQAKNIADRVIKSFTRIGTIFRWFGLFAEYRFKLSDKLANLHISNGFTPKLVAPAMVDYSRWLKEEPVSSISKQVDVFSEISKRSGNKSLVHGYVAFDPLHQLYIDLQKKPHGMDDVQWANYRLESPFEIVKDAINNKGFLGVKVYPPMGFRALRNAELDKFPGQVKKDLEIISDRELGEKLDEVLHRLYEYCAHEDNQIPIISHASDGNEANEHYGDRASPEFWFSAINAHQKLRVCLAHFGHFNAPLLNGTNNPRWDADVWEFKIANFVKNNNDANLYSDMSYLPAVFDKEKRKKRRYAAILINYAQEYDNNLERIIFGTDWIMAGFEDGAQNYSSRFIDFLQKDCHFNQEQIANVMWRNSIRYLGLKSRGKARMRLEAFYNANNLDISRLNIFDA